jgi:sec-independent protein translocase protein TatA
MFGLGTTELLIIAVIVLLLFGSKRLPDIGKGLGGAIREFRQVKKDVGIGGEPEEDKQPEQDPQAKEDTTLSGKLGEKVIEQVPGVKDVIGVKKKVDKVRDIMKT